MDTQPTWERFQHWLFDDPDLGLRLDVSRMGLPDDYPERMAEAMNSAFAAMERLERGEIANPDENRRVGHYWLRAPELAPSDEIREAIETTREAIHAFARKIHQGKIHPPGAERFSELLVVGIGGSALGPQFVADALGRAGDPVTPHFLDNTDPDGFDRVFAALGQKLRQTLTVVISKSGGTAETRNGMLETSAAYRRLDLDLGPHAVAITQADSRLDRHAAERGFIARFPMWDWVGGRTSETSVVGLLPAALQGFDIEAILAGAEAMDAATRNTETGSNPAALLALAWFHATEGRGARDMVVLPYKDRLSLLSRYLQQLVMESLGKERDLDGRVVHQGIAVYGNKGSTDQHAYVQQLRDGVPNFFASFVQVMRGRDGVSPEVDPGVTAGDYLHGFLQGTRQALYDNGRPSLTLTINEVSPWSVGMLIALFERAVGFYASLVNVNAYHQPGVEAGKLAAGQVLDLQRLVLETLAEAGAGAEPVDCEELATRAGVPSEVETVFAILEHLAADPQRGISKQARQPAWKSTYVWNG